MIINMPEALSLLFLEVRKNWYMPRSDFQVEQTQCSLCATEEACKKQNRSGNKTSFQTSITKRTFMLVCTVQNLTSF